jgi:hypothetical protein
MFPTEHSHETLYDFYLNFPVDKKWKSLREKLVEIPSINP